MGALDEERTFWSRAGAAVRRGAVANGEGDVRGFIARRTRACETSMLVE